MTEPSLIESASLFWRDPTWIAAITGLMAVFLSFTSLFLQKFLTSFQMKAALKEKWVNDFKDQLAAYLTCSARIHDVYADGVDLSRAQSCNLNEAKEAFEKYNFYNEKAHELAQKIFLFLNEKKKIHSKLAHELKAADDLLNEWKREILNHTINETRRIEIRDRGVRIQDQIRNTARELIAYELRQLLR